MNTHDKHSVRRFEDGKFISVADDVVIERRIEIDINSSQWRAAMLCLPIDLDALAAGFLLGHGALSNREQIHRIEVDDDGKTVRIDGDFDPDVLSALQDHWTLSTGCGGGVTGDMDFSAAIRNDAQVEFAADSILDISRRFNSRSTLWKRTGCTHACALADADGVKILCEDVGRHNAFDKVIGRALLDGVKICDKFVFTTGRLSAEIVSHSAAAGLTVIVSRSAATDLAIKSAKRHGLTLVGFARGNRLTVYSGFQRIIPKECTTGVRF